MLETKTYSRQELEIIFKTSRRDVIIRKLNSLECEYTVEGRGQNMALTINKIENPFKVFCILELGFSPQTDFNKLKTFLYYFFCSNNFNSLPLREMEHRLKTDNDAISRQTFSNWIRLL
jgi:hypothetical protein